MPKYDPENKVIKYRE